MINDFIVLQSTDVISNNIVILQGFVVFSLFVLFRYFFLFPPFVWLVNLINWFILNVELLLIEIFGGFEELEESQKKAICVLDLEEYNKHLRLEMGKNKRIDTSKKIILPKTGTIKRSGTIS